MMLNKSFGTYLLVSVCYKKKIKIYYLFSIVLFSKEKIVMSYEKFKYFSLTACVKSHGAT
jgi:hypothetical protein